MPTYGYVCSKCGYEFELFQPMTAKPLTICPRDICDQKRWGKGKVKRQLGAGAGLLFKGSGFYITDYRSESYKQGAKSEAPAKPADSSKGNGSSDSKTSSTTPAKSSKPKNDSK